MKSLEKQQPELNPDNQGSFNKFTYIAEDELGKTEARRAAIRAINLAKERLATIIAGQHGDCLVEIRGIGGSFARGTPRLGINDTKTLSYNNLRRIEGMKEHTPEGYLVDEPQYLYPSDIDFSLIFKRKDGSQVTIGDSVVLSRKIHEILEGIYNETGVFISAHDGDPMSVKSVEEVLLNLEEKDDSIE